MRIEKERDHLLIAANQNIRERDYWHGKLSAPLERAVFPNDTDIVARKHSYRLETEPIEINEETAAALQAISKGSEYAQNLVHTAVVTLQLSKYSGSDDIVIGMPIYKQETEDEYINRALALRNRQDDRRTVKEYLQQVRRTITEAVEHQNYPIEILADQLSGDGSTLFDVAVVMKNIHHQRDIEAQRPAVIFVFQDDNGRIEGQLQYDPGKYSRETARRMAGHYAHLLEQMLSNLEAETGDIRLATEQEEKQILHRFNATETEYPGDKSIVQLFEEQVSKAPHRAALQQDNETVTYGELNRRAHRQAHHLIGKGVTPGAVVALRATAGNETIAAILGILKAGAAYMPIDPEYPEERIDMMLKDSQAANELTEEEILEVANSDERQLPPLPGRAQAPTDIIYIIYTSGSTGAPKGVMVEQRSVVRLVKNTGYIVFDTQDRILQTGALEFDASTFEIWGALLNGITLVQIRRDDLINPVELKETLNRSGSTVMWMTSPLFNRMVQEDPTIFKGLKKLLVGGDVLSPQHIRKAMETNPHLEVINGYGPTENTTFSTTHLIPKPPDTAIPIGKPISNSTAYIVDSRNNIQPVGVPGELIVGGDGVARGYMNNPELTADKFIDFSHSPAYKTGDQARWLPGGSIEYLGRRDQQVKIRGYRIEPGEIETQLLTHPTVKEARVIHIIPRTTGENDDKYLCAYIVPTEVEKDTDVQQYKDHLAKSLPDYMIPTYYVTLEKIPLTANGKVDRNALPEPEMTTAAKYVAPRNETEEQLIEIWAEVLKQNPERIGIDDNFFEMGGHSLRATTVISRIYKEFGRELQLREFFSRPTVRQQVESLLKGDRKDYREIEATEEQKYYELSYAQRRLWVLCQFEADSTAYNMPGMFPLSGRFDENAFERAVQEVIDRHETLRTVFVTVDGRPMQHVQPNYTFHLDQTDLRHREESEKEKEARKIYIEEANRVFDLEKGPLLRIRQVRLEEEKCIVIYVIHHIISDGWSQGVLRNEILTGYNARLSGRESKQPPLKLQYRDYTKWHNARIEDDRFGTAGQYWQEKFKDKPNGLELPTDHPRKPVQTFNGRRYPFQLPAAAVAKLQRQVKEEDATLFMGLLSLQNIHLHKLTGRTDIIVGSPIAGRRQPELHGMIGFLVNTLVYRNSVQPEESFREHLRRVREETLQGYQYQDYPFDLLVDKLDLDRDLSQSPLFNVMLAHNNADTLDRNLAMEGVSVTGFEQTEDFNMSKFDLTFFMDKVGEDIYIRLEYNSDLFEHGTIERMAENYRYQVEALLENPDAPISRQLLLHPRQYRQVVRDFNATGDPFPAITIQEQFQRQVEKTPKNKAVIAPGDGGESITYEQLNIESNRLAHYLRNRYDVKPNRIIGISMARSIEQIVVIQGVIKSGAAYVAIDPDYPEDRVMHMLADSRSRHVIRDHTNPALYAGYDGEQIVYSDRKEEIDMESADNPGIVNTSRDTLYIIYTSGTTGTPNGAVLTHGQLSNLVQWQNTRTAIGGPNRCLQFTTTSFCVSFQEITTTLTTGGELHLIGEVERQDAQYLRDYLTRRKIEVLFLPFSYMNYLFNESEGWEAGNEHSLKHIITAGEQLKITPGLKDYLDRHPHIRLHNHYGSSEMHVVTSYTLDAEAAGRNPIPPAGKPISNTKIYILDEHNHPVPVGVWGEIYVEGSEEIAGYIDNAELTQKKRVTLPHITGSHKKLYRSGDEGRWTENGDIQYKGRKDSQVKIRGFRVELSEIESRLLAIDGVKECVVIVHEYGAETEPGTKSNHRDRNRRKELVGYVVLEEREVSEVKKALGQYLPQHMMPRLMQLETLPLMPNGKVDRERLPEPTAALNNRETITQPRNETEEKLAQIWSELLAIEKGQIGIDDSFFELGGHSLKATTMVSRIHKDLGVEVKLLDIFQAPTIRELVTRFRRRKENTIPLEPAEEKDYYPVSFAQRRLYLIHRLQPRSTAYNMATAMELEGDVDADRLEEVFRRIIERQESLRTGFTMRNGQPVQRVYREAEFAIARHEVDNREQAAEILDGFIKPFDLESAPQLRVGLIKIRRRHYILMFDMHHIISDGVSLGILIEEFAARYRGEEYTAMPLQYKDYSIWQNRRKETGKMDRQKEFWENHFEGEIPVLDLITDKKRPTQQHYEGKTIQFRQGRRETGALRKLAKTADATLYMTLQALFTILLSKLGGQEDIVVGTPTAGRSHADLAPIIGMFVNTLAIRNYPTGEKSFTGYLEEVKTTTLEAFENQDYPFEDLVEHLAPRMNRDLARNPLFDVMFSLRNMERTAFELPGLTLKPSGFKRSNAMFDLTLNATEINDGIAYSFEYSTALFEEETITRYRDYFLTLLDRVTANPGIRIEDIEIISDEEKRRIRDQFNDTQREYPADKTLNRLFEEQVERTPERIAVSGPTATGGNRQCLTYKELDEKSGRLAQLLREKGIQPESIAALRVERSLEMVIGIIAILKAGAAYLPIEPDNPPERIEYMLKDSNAVLQLTAKEIEAAAKEREKQIPIPGTSSTPYPPGGTSAHTCYVIYTSGTTGRPKGVQVEHKSVINLLEALQQEYPIGEGDAYLLKTSIAFDVSVVELFGWMRDGGRLAILEKGGEKDPEQMQDSIERERITHITYVPTMLTVFLDAVNPGNISKLSTLKYILSAGEELLPATVEKYRSLKIQARLDNLYGPTETTVYVTIQNQERKLEGQRVPIGKPLPNVQIHIRDKAGRQQPVGIPGEIYISGDALARGYLNNPELTAEKFKQDFTDEGDYPDKNGPRQPYRSYKTGDQARRLPDGGIEYLGRIDRQVKIRGYRIELEEIQNILQMHIAIKDAVVQVREEKDGDKYIYAYIVQAQSQGQPVPESEIREYLAEKLPHYMVPAQIVPIDSIPLTPSGKVDRRAISALRQEGTEEYRPPRNDEERRLQEIWAELLNVDKDRLSIDANFFRLGGHSLKATTLVSRIHRAMDVKIQLVDIFKTLTIRELAAHIKRQKKSRHSAVEPVEEKEYYPASSAQKRLYMLYRLNPRSTAYNMATAVELEGEIEKDKMEDVFRKIIHRQESYRTSFQMQDGQPVQRVHADVTFKIETPGKGEGQIAAAEDLPAILKDFVKPFDLSAAPQLRVGLIKTAHQKHILMFDVHHIVSDGQSQAILQNEIIAHYAADYAADYEAERKTQPGAELPPLQVQYKDYAVRQQGLRNSGEMERQKNYWETQFRGEIPVLNLPLDYNRPEEPGNEGKRQSFQVDQADISKLRRQSKDADVTMYMTIQSLFTVLLSKLSNQEDIVIGTPTAGRNHTDLEPLIGMFVNTLALRNAPKGEKTFESYREEVKTRTLEAFDNQDYQFEDLVEHLTPRINRDLARNPLFDVMFSYQNVEPQGQKIPGLEIKPTGIKRNSALFDMTLGAVEIGEQVAFSIEYSTALFKPATIDRFIGYFRTQLSQIAADPGLRIADIDIISEEEKHHLIEELNDTHTEYPKEKTIPQLFEEQAKRTPDRIALEALENTGSPSTAVLTYRELNERSNRFAQRLRQIGVKQESVIAIKMGRTTEMIEAILGVMKAGGAYMPIALDTPKERIDFMMKDSNAGISITETGIEELSTEPHRTDGDGRQQTSEQVCYVIYTSGTTGRPKGAMVRHRNLHNLVIGLERRIYRQYGGPLKIALLAPFIFDASVKQIFAALLLGHRLCLVPEEERGDGARLMNYYIENGIDVSDGTPTHLRMLTAGGMEKAEQSSLKHFVIGGEPLPQPLVEEFLERFDRKAPKVTNIYGLTECTVDTTAKTVTKETVKTIKQSTIPIGAPMPNSRIYILDKHGRLMPKGATGELCIAGDGVARGYLNRPELTAEKFINSHLTRQTSYLYKSGDQARWHPDGGIEYRGRIDQQVKIRGYRIELGEIENRLTAHPEISDAAVVIKKDQTGDAYICAYIVPQQGEINIEDLKAYQSAWLPAYMHPAHIEQLDRMPLNAGGKVDRRALPEPEFVSAAKYEPPRNPQEKKLADIWGDVLGRENIGIDDNFFEIGGHSLKATDVVSRIHKEFEVEIQLREFFTKATIRQIARQVQGIRTGSGTSRYIEIQPVEEKEYYPLSYAQRRLWVLCQFEEDSTAYNMPGMFPLAGRFNAEAFERAVQAVADRHETLRTVFITVDGEQKQKIIRDLSFKLEQIDLRHREETQRDEETRRMFVDYVNQAFDLEKGPLFRIRQVRLEDEKCIIMFVIHHIISDGWSQGILQNEVLTHYNAMRSAEQTKEKKEIQQLKEESENVSTNASTNVSTNVSTMPPLELQYKDYTQWHNAMIEDRRYGATGDYWQEKFKDKPNGLELPTDRPRKPIQTFNGRRIPFHLDPETMAKLHRIRKEEDATLFMGLLSQLNIFLYHYTGQSDIIVGAPIAGRRQMELRGMIGFLVNTQVYRNRVQPGESYRQHLRRVKEETLTSYDHQDYPFDLLVDQLELERDLSQSPLFNVMLAHNNADTQDRELGMEGMSVTGYTMSNDFNMSKFDLTVFMDQVGEHLSVRMEYNSDLFDHGTVENMKNNFMYQVRQLLENADTPISRLPIIHPDQRRKVLREFNDTAEEYPQITIQELFQRQAAETPRDIAVVAPGDGTLSVTYGELNVRANRMAHQLRNRCGAKPNDIIGISMERSIEMVIAILGVIKSGAAYLAIDPNYPEDRVLHMLTDSRSRQVVTDHANPSLFKNYDGQLITLPEASKDGETIQPEPAADVNPEIVNRPTDIMYVIYTSGTTGTPNGAVLSHGLLANLVQWQTRQTAINTAKRVLQFTSASFCVSFQELTTTLTTGGELHLIGEIERQDAGYIMEYLSAREIEVLYLPFSYLNFLFNDPERWGETLTHNLKHIITAGEQLKITAGLKAYLQRHPQIQLHNHYGSSEMHVVTSFTLDAATAEQYPVPPAGKPVANTAIYILDAHQNPVPIGVWGEIYVEGAEEVAGYINNRRLTEQKLISLPELTGRNRKLYRSGDVGRWTEQGNIQFKGRKDSQVKIRGFRVELSEIESRLLSIRQVKECVVVVVEPENRSTQKELVAYVVAEGIDISEIKKILSTYMPKHMVPRFMEMDSLPLMPNGKVDRDRLPEPEITSEGRDNYVAPQGETEEKLAEIWAELLTIQKDQVGSEDNFFEIGGHSLRATTMVTRIHKELNVKVKLLDIFQGPTIRELAAKIRRMTEEEYQSIEPVEEKEYYPLSSAQKRLYVLNRMNPANTGYHITNVLSMEGEFDTGRAEKIFEQIIRRHESLRTGFELINGEPVQRIRPAVEFNIELVKRKQDEQDADAARHFVKRFIKPFDLTNPPLLRVGALEHEWNNVLFVVDMHHIISDGVSLGILINEFTAGYHEGEEHLLPALNVQYKDYSHWQNRRKESGELEKQGNYWENVFSDTEEIPVLNLPIDKPRPAAQGFEGSALNFQVEPKETQALRKMSKTYDTTMFMTLQAQVFILLSKLSGQEDIVIGTPIAGRRHSDTEPIIGMFVNTLALRHQPTGEKTAAAALQEVKARTLEAFDHQDYQFEDLVDRLTPKLSRETGRNPMFNVLFTLQNMDLPEIKLDGLKIRAGGGGERNTAMFDLQFNVWETGDSLLVNLGYSTELFRRETIERIIGFFKTIQAAVQDNPDVKIRDIDILTQREKQEIVLEFNDTDAEYPSGKTIHRLFREQVEQTPDHIAITTPEEKETINITYRELNRRSNRLAARLIHKGVKSDTIVAAAGKNTVAMIVGILGIMKAGGAYLPIDPENPRERIEYILKDSNAEHLVLAGGEAGKWKHANAVEIGTGKEDGKSIDIIEVEEELKENSLDILTSQTPANQPLTDTPNHLCYVIYTSGSTGRPKAVAVEHRGVVNTLAYRKKAYKMDKTVTSLQLFSLTFDGFVTSFFTPVISGGRVVLPSSEHQKDIAKLGNLIQKHSVTHMITVPMLFQALLEQMKTSPARESTLKTVTVAGDRLSPRIFEQLRAIGDKVELVNEYGVTEASVMSTINRNQERDEQVKIGKPTANTKIYICNGHQKLQPVGITGEICIGGVGLSRGYLNNPELTAEKFISSRYTSHDSLIYKTGDRGRWLPDGRIEYQGRIDHQVKIRGFRIETGEIENRLREQEGVGEAVVIAREDRPGHKSLCAYITADIQKNPLQIKQALAEHLPHYMIPDNIVQLTEIPLTPNGKVNLKKLPKPEVAARSEYTAPTNQREETLVRIWSEVLGIEKEQIGIDANYFELGGNSINIMSVMTLIKEEYSEELPVVKLFAYPTVRALSGYLEQNNNQVNKDQASATLGEDRTEVLTDRRSKLKARRRR